MSVQLTTLEQGFQLIRHLRNDRVLCCKASLFFIFNFAFFTGGAAAIAQNIALDGTLGPAATLTGPNYQIRQELGQTVGSNLFHSFGKFNLTAGEQASFFSNPQIRNIFSRVTGGSPSSIDGLIATTSFNVNLYLINPAGILFGSNAQLDIGGTTRGSFVATTLDAMTFPNEQQFSATNPGNSSSLLTIVGDPSGFLASQRTPQPISVTGSSLGVYPGQSLLLLGGNVTLDNSNLFVAFPQGGRIELGGISGAGIVGLSISGNDLQFTFPAHLTRADIIINQSTIDVLAENAGSIGISAHHLKINQSGLFAGIGSRLGSGNSQAGDITLDVTGTMSITRSEIFNNVNDGAIGNGGNIAINTDSFLLDQSLISVTTQSRGNAGQVAIQVNGSALLTGSSTIFNTVSQPAGEGLAGGIRLTAGSLSLLQGSQIVANTEARGSTSDITVNVRGAILFDGQDRNGEASGIFNVVRPEGRGNSGSIILTGESLTLTNGARLQTNTRGIGNAGNVQVRVRDFLYFDAVDRSDRNNFTGIFTAVGTDGRGNGGNIDIEAGSLAIVNGAQLTANTFAQGNAGNIQLTIHGTALFSGFSSVGVSGAFSAVGEVKGNNVRIPAFGQAGNIYIESESLTVTDGARFGTAVISGSQGNGGGVTIVTRNTTLFSGVNSNGTPSGIATLVEPGAIGNVNNIDITTDTLIVTNGALLDATIAGSGKAGNINVQATNLEISKGGRFLTTTIGTESAGNIVLKVQDQITLTGTTSGLFANTEPGSTGNGGNIFIDPKIVVLGDGSRISVDSQGTGAGGSIEIQAGKLILHHQALISAETASNQGGNILLQLQDYLLLRYGSQISTTAGTAQAGGDGGNITINAPRGFIIGVKGENSDITANAFTGNGGKVNITAQGIYGLQFRPQLTPFSDITASSQFGVSGVVTLNTLGIDPSRSLTNLPINLADPSRQIAQTCAPSGPQRASSFVYTGRGGIPLSPDEPLEESAVVRGWVALPEESEDRSQESGGERQKAGVRSIEGSQAIVEAQGWMVDEKGVVHLVAEATGDRVNQPLTGGVSCTNANVAR